MKIYDIEVHGIERALRGLARSYDRPLDAMRSRATKLAPLDRGHNKFLRMIQLWCEVEAPRFWWAEYDTYKVGTVAQSDSTMHTLTRRSLTREDFEYGIHCAYLNLLNENIQHCRDGDMFLHHIKNDLPEGFIQGRTLNFNYATLREITLQRYNHRLPQWQLFLSTLLTHCPHIEYLGLPERVLAHLEIQIFPTNEK